MPHGMIKTGSVSASCKAQNLYQTKTSYTACGKAPETVGQKTQMKCKAFGVEEIKTLVSS